MRLCSVLLGLLVGSRAEEESLEGQLRRRKKAAAAGVGAQFLAAATSSYDLSVFPPCFNDSDCVNGLGEEGICTFGESELTGSGVRKRKPTTQSLVENEALSYAFDKYLKRSLWTIFRSALTRESVGTCTPMNENMLLQDQQQRAGGPLEDGSAGEESLWELINEPLEYDLPSVLKKYAPSGRLSLGDLESTMNVGSLGEIQCSPITKVGRFDGKGTPTHGRTMNGVPINGAFLLRFTPLVTSPPAGLALSKSDPSSVRYISEPYEYFVSSHKLRSTLAISPVTVPSHQVIQRREMKGILNLMSDLGTIARYKSMDSPNERFWTLQEYIDPQMLSLIKPSLARLVDNGLQDPPKIYLSLREITHGVEMMNGVLTLMCDNPGEGQANVEVTYFLPSPTLLKAFHQLIEPHQYRGPGLTLEDFIRGIEQSTVDQNLCPARILCVEA